MRFVRGGALATVLVAAMAGCGNGDRREAPPASVAASLDLGSEVVTGQEAFGFTGRVRPPDSAVTVERAGGSAGPVVVEPSGRFSAAVGGLRPGTNVIRIRATRPGRRSWRREIRVVRAASAPMVSVPDKDVTPPVALLRLHVGPGTPAALTVSPSAPGDRSDPLRLERPRFTATALVRDDGGAGRIRLSTTYHTTCDGQVTPRHVSFPPAQIVNVRLAPGARVRAEETRTVSLPLETRTGCTVAGEAWAEATDGAGLQAVSRHVAYRYP